MAINVHLSVEIVRRTISMEIVRRNVTEGKSVVISAKVLVLRTAQVAKKSAQLDAPTQDALYPAKCFVSFA